jgi:hypothetical protein
MSYKKYIQILIVGMLILSGLNVIALEINKEDMNLENYTEETILPVKPSYTHTILAEFGTTTWCGWCKYAHGALKNLYLGKWDPFFYTTMVADKNMHAAYRIWSDYNCYGYPTVFWDGGHVVIGGSGSIPGAMDTYNKTIIQCGTRYVPDIDINLNVNWLGNAAMDIDVSVDNNEESIYGGYIRVYITEVSSTLGWIDYGDYPYTFVFLEYAFDENISIPSYGTWQDSIVWDGHDYYYGVGYDFGNISYGNIMVIAAVFNEEWHQGYAYPPDANPFDAYWVDDVVGFRVGSNSLPNIPSDPKPEDDITDVSTEVDLCWNGGDPNQWNPQDTVTYDVYFGKDYPPVQYATIGPYPCNQTLQDYDPGTLDIKTTYYWQIVARDNHGAVSEGPIWQFTTSAVPNGPPNSPTIKGPTTGKVGVEYNWTFTYIDPNNDEITYIVQWDDGCGSQEWVGPYPSGEEVTLSHTYSREGTFTIYSMAMDIYNAESDWSELGVTMPRNKAINNAFLRFFQNHQNLFPILRLVLQRLGL